MKKIFSVVCVALLMLGVLSFSVRAAGASASLSGPDVVRAGDTITLTFKVNGSKIYGITGTLAYDESQLTLGTITQKIGGDWAVEVEKNELVIYDNTMNTPINSNTTILTATFKVKDKLAAGTKITVSIKDVTTTDGTEDSAVGTVSYSATIAPPKSEDNSLKSLTVSNATISPAFDPKVTAYTASVPYEISKLNVSAVANDAKAKVSVNSPDLTPDGRTNVTVTVTAENGSKKTYTISVHRAQDPNYVPSDNNKLSGIKVDGFLLSPGFSPDRDRYVIWLPYETDRVTVSGTAADKKASVRVEGGSDLVAGADNEIKIICTAENGTEKVYTVIAKRAAAHDGSTEPTVPPTEPPTQPPTEPKPTEPPTEPPTQPPTEPAPTQPLPTEPTEPSEPAPTEPQKPVDPEQPGGIPWWSLLLVGTLCLAAGMGLGMIMSRKRR